MLFDLSFPQEVTSGAVSKNLIISRMPYSRATSKPIGRLLMLGKRPLGSPKFSPINQALQVMTMVILDLLYILWKKTELFPAIQVC